MEISEKDIENYVIKEDLLLEEYGLEVIAQQYRTQYGIIDILCYNPAEKRIVVVELKKGVIDENAVGQLLRYMATIKEMILGLSDEENKGIRDTPQGLLLGTSVSQGVRIISRNYPIIRFALIDISLCISNDQDHWTRIEESLQKDIDYYLNSEAFEKIKDFYKADQHEIEIRQALGVTQE
jgi:hypothetical protein